MPSNLTTNLHSRDPKSNDCQLKPNIWTQTLKIPGRTARATSTSPFTWNFMCSAVRVAILIYVLLNFFDFFIVLVIIFLLQKIMKSFHYILSTLSIIYPVIVSRCHELFNVVNLLLKFIPFRNMLCSKSINLFGAGGRETFVHLLTTIKIWI